MLSLILALQLNTLTIQLSVVALILAATYPFMKRVHMLPQVHLGVAFAWAIPMAHSALTNTTPDLSNWLVFITAIIWTTAYDTMYGMADKEDDVKLGLKSTAILFGENDKTIVGLLQLAVIICLALVGVVTSLGIIYYLSVIIASGFFVYQQYLIRDRDRLLCFQAFLNNNWVGMIIFIGLALDYWLLA
ncbi:UNVERIFIED_CONTAM: hypothetical protein GTU68_054315 [Idotea baltica]|nr:hypothetical protein [Idotea baltica]